MSSINSSKGAFPSREEVYKALLRSLKRRRGFGIVFVQCSPAEAKRVIKQIEQDLPEKRTAVLRLTEPINNLYDLVESRSDCNVLNILFIQGLEESLEPYIKPGYGGEGDYYNIDTVPAILSHLNQRREIFRDHFKNICFVFVLPAFAVKYIIRRAPDFFDWGAGVFDFSVGETEVIASGERSVAVGGNVSGSVIITGDGNVVGSGNVVQRGKYNLSLGSVKGLQVGDTHRSDRDIADVADAKRVQGKQLLESRQLDEALSLYEEALNLYQKLGDQAEIVNTLKSIGDILQLLKQYDQALSVYRQAVLVYQQTNLLASEASSMVGLGVSAKRFVRI